MMAASHTAAPRPATVCSIPSRFETSLVPGAQETRAFGSATHRFPEGGAGDLPGPGHYTGKSVQSPLVRRAATCGSVSSKGYTALASRTDRFGRAVRALEHQALGPGPGSYEVPHEGGAFAVKAKRGPRMCAPTHFRGEEPAKYLTLGAGPGAYHNEQSTRAMRDGLQRPSSVMCSGSARIHNALKSNSTVSANGAAYDVAAATDYLRNQGRNPSLGPDSFFKSRSGRGQFLMERSSENVPGPGSYEPAASAAASAADLNASMYANSSMFSNTNTDRFGRQYEAKAVRVVTPGPGHYGLPDLESVAGGFGSALGSAEAGGGGGGGSTATYTGDRSGGSGAGSLLAVSGRGNRTRRGPASGSGYNNGGGGGGASVGGSSVGRRWTSAQVAASHRGSSAFRSQTERFEVTMKEKLGQAPGPAFYQPGTSLKKSFILNTDSKWL